MVSGKVRHNQRRNRTRFRFSSDGDPKVTYRCKLDDGEFDDCEFIAFIAVYSQHTVAYIIDIFVCEV